MKTRNQFLSLFIWILVTLVIIQSASASPIREKSINSLRDIRVNCEKKNCSLVLETPQPIHYHFFFLKNPNRLIIDLEDIRLVRKIKLNFSKSSVLTGVRSAVSNTASAQTLRLVFNLSQPAIVKAVTLPFQKKHGYRLVFKVTQVQIASPSPSPSPITIPSHTHRSSQVIIVIDPGHGGHDAGATGIHGIHEKNVVLPISKFLMESLNRKSGFKAYLTRSGDYYLTLRQRLAVARRYKADLFVAIHADAAYRNHRAQGATIFALSQRGATSEAARWLARQENASELMGGVGLADKDNMLKSVLLNLSQTATIQSSLLLGQQLIRSLNRVTALHHHRVEQAAFVVLKSPDIPSLLVETGFISNPTEERKLYDPYYERQMAQMIADGIQNYFTQNPPRGTWLASKTH